MPIINIEVRNKIAKSPVEKIVCGNSDYVIAFDFDEGWDKYVEKTAFFVCNNGVTLPPVIFQGNQCPVPVISNTTMVSVGVSAGDLHTTTKAVIGCEKSIRCGLNEPQEPKPDVYAQLMQMINDGKIKGDPFRFEDFTEEQLAALIPKKEINDYIDKEIAEFDFVKVVDVLPETGLANREYFVRKSKPDTNDLFDEWAWINKGTEDNPNWDWEFKGTKKIEIDLKDYTKKTDFGQGFYVDDEGYVRLVSNTGALESRVDFPILGSTMDWAWKEVATNNKEKWSDADWEKFYTFIGAVKDYHNNRNGLARFNNGRIDVTDATASANAVNLRTLEKAVKANYSIQYFDVGDLRDTSVKTLKLGSNTMFIITENSSYQASALGSVDVGGTITDSYDLLPHEKSSTLGKYYDVATTIFMITNGDNSPYTNRDDMRSVVRMTLDGLSTSLKFFFAKEQSDGTVLTLSMKSSGQHRECVLLGSKKIE